MKYLLLQLNKTTISASLYLIIIGFIIAVSPASIMAMKQNNSQSQAIRIATFNIGLDSAREKGKLRELLLPGDHVAALKSAEIIQRIRPDILLINEIDGNDAQQTLKVYLNNYLGKGINGQQAINYDYVFMPKCNTGVDSGIKFRDKQHYSEPEQTDNFGFGYYDGQYCMAVLSRYPIEQSQIQTFQQFLWKDLPAPLFPSLDGVPWYNEKGLDHIRLSSKTHADVPISINGKILHLLISHPTPPVFDGDEDRHGKRNHDEIKFWQYYINGNTQKSDGSIWLYNDSGNASKGLSENQAFVIMGDLNASMVEGDATVVKGLKAIESLIHDNLVADGFSEKQNSRYIPQSFGGKENQPEGNYSQFHTAAWKMRVDYVLPSAFGMRILGSGVYWPKKENPHGNLVNGTEQESSSSDHRLVWLDVELTL